jgi:hypothetical protein
MKKDAQKERSELCAQTSEYVVLEREGAANEAQKKIACIVQQAARVDAARALAAVQVHLRSADFSDCGWPPTETGDVLTLHADVQRTVSAVLVVDHGRRQLRILKYIVKGAL